MIKALGAVLLAGGSFCLGEHRARQLKSRVEVLDRLLVGLEGLSRELELRLAPLPQLMEELSVQVEPPVRDLFLSCRKAMEGLRQESFAQAWGSLVEQIPYLHREDKRVLQNLGYVLGRYDGRGQCAAISNVCRGLTQNREQAWQTNCRLGRVYRSLGVLGGGFLIVLLL